MAGQPLKRLRDTRVDNLIHMVETSASDIVQALIDSAKGLKMEREGKDGKPFVYTRSPDIRAATYLLDRMMGSPRQEEDPVITRLNTARAVYEEERVLQGLIEAQRRELMARAVRAEIEGEQWPKQFVTVEDELANLQALARSINYGIMSLTPEWLEDCVKGRSISEALEIIKEKIGRTENDIIEEVMQKRIAAVEGAEEEDEDETEQS